MPAPTARMAAINVGGQAYWIAQLDAGPWMLAMGEPAVSDGWMLGWLLSDLTGPILLAFPLVLVPLWVTVRRGIRPVRDLARRLEQRDGGDLSPLALDMRYAELQPLATAFDAMLERLRNHVRRERAFVQDAAHELRTPMAAIAAQAHVLARAPDAAQRRHAEEALDHALARSRAPRTSVDSCWNWPRSTKLMPANYSRSTSPTWYNECSLVRYRGRRSAV